jgi:photosystem II stability/assembly factor-like uncharacterized protein
MLKIAKKIFVISLLVIISISFSGCLGLGNSNTNTASTRNDSQGVFKSVDGGKTWEHKVAIEGSELRLDQIKIGSMAIDPQDNKVLYLGTLADGLYKTQNGGDSWFKVQDSNGALKESTSIYDISVESGNSNIIYLATLNENRGVLIKSEDGGKTWIESYISSEAGKQINRVQIDSNNRNVVYIGTEQGGLLKSENRGRDWVAINWFEEGVKNFVVDFKNPNGIMVLTEESMFKTVDGGKDPVKSWEDLSKKIKEPVDSRIDFKKISSMTIDNKNPLIIYLTYVNLIIITKDGGQTWELLNTITPALTAVNTIPNIRQIGMFDETIYYGAGNALYKSENKGASWSSVDIPIKGDAQYTVSDYSDPNIIYVGTFYNPPSKKK